MSTFLLLRGLQDDNEENTKKDDLSSSDGKSILAFARSLGPQPADLVRLYDRRDHYVCVGRDADTIAASYFRSSAAIKYWSSGSSGEAKQPYLTINKKMAGEVIRACLLSQRRRLETYQLDGSKWVLSRRGSPGNIQAFEDECLVHGELPASASTVIAAVKLGRTAGGKGYSGNARLVGVTFVDVSGRFIRTSEFEDDESLCTLESLLCQQGTREVLMQPEMDVNDRRALELTLDASEVTTTEGAKGSFAPKHVEQDLRRLLGVEGPLHARFFETGQQLPAGCFTALSRYLDLPGLAETHGQWSLEWVEPREFLRLDASAMRALNVEPDPHCPDKNGSLLGIFTPECKTAGGGRLLRKWLKQPLLSAYEIEQRLDLVQTFISSFGLRGVLRERCLPAMAADLDRVQRRLFSGRASLQDVVLLYSLLKGLPPLVEALASEDGYADGEDGEEGRALVEHVFGSPLRETDANFEKFRSLVSAAVDLEAIKRHEFLIRPHFDESLIELGERKEELVGQIYEAHGALCDRLGMDEGRLKLDNAPPHGYHYRVTRKDETQTRGHKDLSIIATKKDGVYFRCAKLEKLASRYKDLSARYTTEQTSLVSKVVDTAATFCPLVAELGRLLSKLDVLLAFASVSVSAPEPYVRPTLLGPDAPRTVELRGARPAG